MYILIEFEWSLIPMLLLHLFLHLFRLQLIEVIFVIIFSFGSKFIQNSYNVCNFHNNSIKMMNMGLKWMVIISALCKKRTLSHWFFYVFTVYGKSIILFSFSFSFAFVCGLSSVYIRCSIHLIYSGDLNSPAAIKCKRNKKSLENEPWCVSVLNWKFKFANLI